MSFEREVTKNFVVLTEQLNLASIMPYLMQEGIFTRDMEERCNSEKTTISKNMTMLTMLWRRGPNARFVFVDSLVKTGQTHLARLFEPSIESVVEPTPVKVRSRVFDKFLAAVTELKPLEKTCSSESVKRSGNSYVTTINFFNDEKPKSELGVREIPCLMAVQSGLFGQDIVLSWHNVPPKKEFERQLRVYNDEIEELSPFLSMMENGGFDWFFRPSDERIGKLLARVVAPFVKSTEFDIRLKFQMFSLGKLSANDSQLVKCIIHLMCFGECGFIIRKTTPPKPNAYLLFNAERLQASDAILERDRQWVMHEIAMDESVVVNPGGNTSCPW